MIILVPRSLAGVTLFPPQRCREPKYKAPEDKVGHGCWQPTDWSKDKLRVITDQVAVTRWLWRQPINNSVNHLICSSWRGIWRKYRDPWKKLQYYCKGRVIYVLTAGGVVKFNMVLTLPQKKYMCVKNFKSDNDNIDLKYFSWPLITNIFRSPLLGFWHLSFDQSQGRLSEKSFILFIHYPLATPLVARRLRNLKCRRSLGSLSYSSLKPISSTCVKSTVKVLNCFSRKRNRCNKLHIKLHVLEFEKKYCVERLSRSPIKINWQLWWREFSPFAQSAFCWMSFQQTHLRPNSVSLCEMLEMHILHVDGTMSEVPFPPTGVVRRRSFQYNVHLDLWFTLIWMKTRSRNREKITFMVCHRGLFSGMVRMSNWND